MDRVFRLLIDFLHDFIALFQPSHEPSLSRMHLGPEGQNPLMFQFFTWDTLGTDDVSWWKYFELEVPRLAEMGVTQVWLPPPNKGMNKRGRGYDAYDLWDLGEFNQKGTIATRWGTKAELLHACQVAKDAGIEVLIDAVLNHKLGADAKETFPAVSVDPNNRNVEIGPEKEIEGWTIFNFPGRGERYSSLKWNKDHFTGVDWDDKTKKSGVYRIAGGREGWSQWVDDELGNYDYLLGIDIDHRHPDVQQDFFSWGAWVLETTGSNGFRLDAIKHIDRRFVHDFVKKTRELPGREKLFAVGEYWHSSGKKLESYMRAFKGQLSFFDVPLHNNLHIASKAGSKYDLRRIFDDTLIRRKPGDAVVFVDNHDTAIGQSLESWVEPEFKPLAYALILLRPEGYPCVYYGDLYPSQLERSDRETTVAQKLEQLIRVRKHFAYGPVKDYALSANCTGFVRLGDENHPDGCAVVLCNADDKDTPMYIRMNVGLQNANSTFCDIMRSSEEKITISPDGWGVYPSRRLSVWIRENSPHAASLFSHGPPL